MEKKPDPVKILSTLVDLYADQMGVKITYTIEGTNNECITK